MENKRTIHPDITKPNHQAPTHRGSSGPIGYVSRLSIGNVTGRRRQRVAIMYPRVAPIGKVVKRTAEKRQRNRINEYTASHCFSNLFKLCYTVPIHRIHSGKKSGFATKSWCCCGNWSGLALTPLQSVIYQRKVLGLTCTNEQIYKETRLNHHHTIQSHQ